ncbi:MAG: hypothetical protein HMLKMBBP_01415 [Planctomycetes bacterium]|nr:hypothetical protein [Planctomycetota bacterium]
MSEQRPGAGPIDLQWLRNRFASLNRSRDGPELAPHKPLALLAALGNAQRGDRSIRFNELGHTLRRLIHSFGGAHWDSGNVRDPIWRLQTDGIWQVSDVHRIEMEASKRRPSVVSLRHVNPETYFTTEVVDAFRSHPEWIAVLARDLLDANFSPSLHAAIAHAAGIVLAPHRVSRTALARDAKFRNVVLDAYGSRCAICGYDDQLGGDPLALEAAHVQWHCAGGPSTLANGLCLCAIHHVAFDSGALCISTERVVVVSADVKSGARGSATLAGFSGRPLASPRHGDAVSQGFLEWHRKVRFREPAA